MKVSNSSPTLKLTSRQALSASPRQTVTFVYDPDGRDSIKGARLIGSWNPQGDYSDSWKDSGVAMKRHEDGTYRAEVALDPTHEGEWQWGIKADGPAGKDRWAVLEEDNLRFRLDEETKEVTYRPTNLSLQGATRHDNDLSFRYWAPNARDVRALVWDPKESSENSTAIPLIKNANGAWSASVKNGWESANGKVYGYEVVTSDGTQTLAADPYARQRQGPQRGLDDLFLDAKTGTEVHKFASEKVTLTRFEVQEYPNLKSVNLVLFDDNGERLTAEQVREKLSAVDAELVQKFHGDGKSDFWSERLEDSGAIRLLPQGKAFATVLPGAQELKGLSYSFEGYDGDGKLLGDLNGDGRLQTSEAQALPFNDPYSNKLQGDHRWQRYGIIEDDAFEWKNDEAPRLAKTQAEQVIYQIHPGSIFGSDKNVDRTTFDDITKRLDYFKDLGVNTLELMPVGSTEGSRDWGYIGSHNLAVSENYGYTDENGQWVEGDEALKKLVDAAHEKGLKVFNDVVYNHFGGDYNNVWNVGGKENPWFEWSEHPSQPNESTKATPWGSLPAYNKAEVKDFITNHALHQLDTFHFDGLRFDFTHPIHEQGPNGGGDEGWEMLQKIHRTIDFFHPDAFTAAEEFPSHPIIVTPADTTPSGGAGFDAMWNTEFQHRLVHDHGNPSVLQEAVHGDHTRVDKLMEQLLRPAGFRGTGTAVTVVSNHDEVGNADRTINVANGHRPLDQAGPWERGVARTTLGIGLLSPGMPIFFQGEESLADNHFSWGIPSTWDVGWDWLEKPESPRFKHHSFSKAVLAVRNQSDAFKADAEAQRVYTHESDSVLAFSRKGQNNEEYLVVASFNKGNLENYTLPVQGRWEPVLDSDAPEFGGLGEYSPKILEESSPTLNLSAGGMLVYRRTA